jgi:hypothetical protein
MSNEIATKSEFATIANVSAGRVSQWIASGKLGGDALVGSGRKARIRVAVALQQLSRSLDVVQWLGANGKAKAAAARARADGNDDGVPDTVEAAIKQARLEQLALSNAAARRAEGASSGRYVLAVDAKQEMGRVAAQVLAVVDSALSEMANAVMAAKPVTPRDALRVLRASWRSSRERAAKAKAAEAAAMPLFTEDDQAALGGGQMFKGEPTDDVKTLLDEINREAVRGSNSGNLNYLMPAFSSLLVNLSNAADRRAQVVEKWTRAIVGLTVVLVVLTAVLVWDAVEKHLPAAAERGPGPPISSHSR